MTHFSARAQRVVAITRRYSSAFFSPFDTFVSTLRDCARPLEQSSRRSCTCQSGHGIAVKYINCAGNTGALRVVVQLFPA